MAELSERDMYVIMRQTAKEMSDAALSKRKWMLEQGISDQFFLCIELDRISRDMTDHSDYAIQRIKWINNKKAWPSTEPETDPAA